MNEFQAYIPYDAEDEVKHEKRYLSRVLFSMFWGWFGGIAVIIALQLILVYAVPEVAENQWISMCMNSAYTIVAMIVFMIALPGNKGQRHPVTATMRLKSALRFFVIAYGIMFAGSFVGNGLSAVLGMMMNTELENAVDMMVDTMGYGPVILSAVILAPVFEELLFRKLLIDALARYGTVFCVAVSGLIFGVFHGNFYQFFYAFGLGALLAYIYCVYGKIRYTIIFHAIINFIGSVVPMAILDLAELGIDLTGVYALLYLTVSVIGIYFAIADIKWLRCYAVGGVLVKPFKILVNPGFVVLMIFGIMMFALYMI